MHPVHGWIVNLGMELARDTTHFTLSGWRNGGRRPSGGRCRIADNSGRLVPPGRVFGPDVSQT